MGLPFYKLKLLKTDLGRILFLSKTVCYINYYFHSRKKIWQFPKIRVSSLSNVIHPV